MNVLSVLPLYPPKSRVGAWITTHEYLRELAGRGHRVDVLQLMSNHDGYEFEGVHVHPRTWTDYTPDLVVSHLGDQGEGAKYATEADLPSVRFVHGYHDENANRLNEWRTDLAIFSSHALKADASWDGPSLVAHPPIRPDEYRTNPGQHITLVNLADVKGGELFKLLATSLHDIPFLGVRGGWGKQVHPFPGNVEVISPVEDMREVYQRTRILLMPSERESFGRVAVEAACSGIPTIAHPCAGLVEAMGDSATWLDRTDLTAWVQTIRTLHDSAVWEAASARASAHVAELDPAPSVSRVVTAIEELTTIGAPS